MAVFILAGWRGMYQGLDRGKAGCSPPERVVAYVVTGPETAFEEASLWSGRRVTTIWGISVVIMAP
jgi:hypothetical protein